MRRAARSSADVGTILVVGVAALLVLTQWPAGVALRAGLGLPFMLMGVGYVASCALYARDRPDGPNTLLLALAFSVAIIIVTSLVLYALGIAFTGESILSAELVVTATLAAVAVARRARGGLEIGLPTVWRMPSVAPTALALVAPVAVFAGLVVVLARSLPNSKVAGYSALSATRGQGSTIDVGLTSAQLKQTTYRVVIAPGRGRPQTFAVTLRPGQTWGRVVSFPGPSRQPVTVRLYRDPDAGQIYRQLTLQP